MTLSASEIDRRRSVVEHLGITAASIELGVPRSTLKGQIGNIHTIQRTLKPFEADELPDELPTAEELRLRRRKEYQRKDASERARRLIDVKINIDGPIGIVHFGDPHVDDPGTDIEALETHVNLVNKTEGLFGANVGDLQNNWGGKTG